MGRGNQPRIAYIPISLSPQRWAQPFYLSGVKFRLGTSPRQSKWDNSRALQKLWNIGPTMARLFLKLNGQAQALPASNKIRIEPIPWLARTRNPTGQPYVVLRWNPLILSQVWLKSTRVTSRLNISVYCLHQSLIALLYRKQTYLDSEMYPQCLQLHPYLSHLSHTFCGQYLLYLHDLVAWYITCQFSEIRMNDYPYIILPKSNVRNQIGQACSMLFSAWMYLTTV